MSLMFAALNKLDSPTGSAGRPTATAAAAMPWPLNAVRTLGLPALAIGGALLTAWWLYPAHQQALATEQPSATGTSAAITPNNATAIDAAVDSALVAAEPTVRAADVATMTIALAGSSTPPQAPTAPLKSHIRADVPEQIAPPATMPATEAPPAALQVTRATPEAQVVPEPTAVTAATPMAVAVSARPRRPVASIEAEQSPAQPATAEPATNDRARREEPPRLPSERLVVRHGSNSGHADPGADAAQAHAGDRKVGQIITALGAAIEAGNFASGQQQLDQLAARLPRQSLTLLRMQAWFAHESGDITSAVALYRRIIERVPHDKTAAINLALLETRKGLSDSARDRLRHLRSVGTDSREVERAMTQVEARLQ